MGQLEFSFRLSPSSQSIFVEFYLQVSLVYCHVDFKNQPHWNMGGAIALAKDLLC